jgi:hypothetical protein
MVIPFSVWVEDFRVLCIAVIQGGAPALHLSKRIGAQQTSINDRHS